MSIRCVESKLKVMSDPDQRLVVDFDVQVKKEHPTGFGFPGRSYH